MIGILAAFTPLTDRMQAIRDHFTASGRWAATGAVLLVLAGCLLALALVHHLRTAAERREPDNPVRLFRTLLRSLGLTSRQCRILKAMAGDLKLQHPTVILLSPRLFAEQATAWRKMRGGQTPTGDLEAIQRQVFPDAAADQ